MTCPICKKPSVPSARPFCSKRCADLDLAHWLNGSYAVASHDPDDEESLREALDEVRKGNPLGKPH